MKSRHFALILSLAVALLMTPAFAQTTYSFQTVNYPGDTFTQLLGINNSGDIAGYHNFLSNSGFTYSLKAKQFTTENFTGSQMTQVIGINNEPFKTSGFYVKGGKTEGFTDYQGTMQTVNFPHTPFNQLLSQNDFRQSAGYYSTKGDGTGPDHAYVYDETGGVFELFVIPNSISAQATGINNSDDVCGFTIDSNGMHGWVKVHGIISILDDPHGVGTTAALGLNNKGQVVGSYSDTTGPAGNSHGFVYTISTKSFETVDDPSGVGVTVVNGINDNGVLVGFYGTNPDNSGFVATPE